MSTAYIGMIFGFFFLTFVILGYILESKENFRLRGPDEVLDIDFRIPESSIPDIDCEAGFTEYGECDKECGGGLKKRTYIVNVPSSGEGMRCLHGDGYIDEASCNETVCPVDCVSYWGDPTPCSVECGGGETSREYIIQTPSVGTGLPCDHVNGWKDVTECNTHPCPIDCVGGWSEYDDCTKACGGGEQTSIYEVDQIAQYGGEECPEDDGNIRTRDCNTQECPIDCIEEERWSDCDKDCGPGIIKKRSYVKVEPKYGGRPCELPDGHLLETKVCELKPCPIDCEGEVDEEWGACSEECGPGKKTKKYKVSQVAMYGGEECPYEDGDVVETDDCQVKPCPIDCEGEVLDWGDCSAECGEGITQRIYSVEVPAQHGGLDCPYDDGDVVEEKDCEDKPCPIDCEGYIDKEWSSCSKTCGVGEITKKYNVTQEPMYGGKECPFRDGEVAETEECDLDLCPVNCKGEVDAEWSECSKECGPGLQAKYYNITTPAKNGGIDCHISDGEMVTTRSCELKPCPIDCEGYITNWGKCDKDCGGGKSKRIYIQTTMAEHEGKECPYAHQEVIEEKDCNTQECPIDCKYKWTDWGECSAECEGGTRTRNIEIISQPKFGGRACPTLLTDEEECNTQDCPVDCVQEWEPLYPSSACKAECDTPEIYIATNRVKVFPTGGGKPCEKVINVNRACPPNPCPVICEGEWSDEGAVCDKVCGGGKQILTYKHTVKAEHGGEECEFADGATKEEDCNTEPCPIDCVGKWGSWSSCSQDCGGGQKSRRYKVELEPMYGGKQCEASNGKTEYKRCNTTTCNDCKLVKKHSACNKTCGKGQRHAWWEVERLQNHGGKTCSEVYGKQLSQIPPWIEDCEDRGCKWTWRGKEKPQDLEVRVGNKVSWSDFYRDVRGYNTD